MRSFATFAIATLLVASAAQAQTKSLVITGTVIDSANHKPLSQAVIFLGRTPTGQRTGSDGKFRITTDSGAHVVMIRHWGYVPALVAVRESSADTADAGLTGLRQVKTDEDRAAVENLDVQVFPELARFYDHKTNYRMGLFFTPDEMQRVGGSLFNLIRQKANFHFICFTNRRGEFDCGQEASRGRTSIMNANPTSREQEPCLMDVWTNALGPHRTLDEFQMDDVLAVEAYPNPGVTPPDFGGSPCAAVMLWMKQTTSTPSVGVPR